MVETPGRFRHLSVQYPSIIDAPRFHHVNAYLMSAFTHVSFPFRQRQKKEPKPLIFGNARENSMFVHGEDCLNVNTKKTHNLSRKKI